MKKNWLFIMALALCLVAAPAAEAAVVSETGVEMTATGKKKTTKKKTTSKKSSTKKSTKKSTSKTSSSSVPAATLTPATTKAEQTATQEATTQRQATQSSGSVLGSVLGGILGAATGSSSSSGTVGGIISGLSTIFDANKQASVNDLAGTWSYTEPAIVFQSDNALSNIGGKVAAKALESKLQEQFNKFGIKKGAMKMTFDKDGNFTQTIAGKTLSGTYTISKKQVVLKYAGTVQQFIGTTQVDGNDLLIVMDASKLLKYANAIGSLTGNSLLKTAGNLLGSMDGMLIGLKLDK